MTEEKYKAFMSDLAELCVKHNVFVELDKCNGMIEVYEPNFERAGICPGEWKFYKTDAE